MQGWMKRVMAIGAVIFIAMPLYAGQGDRGKPAKAWAEPATGMEFVWVPGGCFEMGQSEKEKEDLIKEAGEEEYKKYYTDELPRHTVCVDGFYMGKYEVTVGQWRAFVEATGYKSEAEKEGWAYGWDKEKGWVKKEGIYWDRPGFAQADDSPVTCISWNDAVAFAAWLSKKAGKAFRLPTEAQWEYACRGGTATARYWGDSPDDACGYANVADQSAKRVFSDWTIHECDDGYVYTSPVGHYKPNGYGLYDMLGNVWEWCADWYGKDYYGNSPRRNPMGPATGKCRVVRGGSWGVMPRSVRSAVRDWYRPGKRNVNLGFRLALPSGVKEK